MQSESASANRGQQLIGEKMQQLAKQYTGEDASAYDAAGKAFRLPYWDWASDARVPPSCTRQNITVNGPDGRVTIRNPLYSYRWHEHPLDQSLFPNSNTWGDETTRSPNDNTTFPVDEVNAKLSQQAQIITLRVVSDEFEGTKDGIASALLTYHAVPRLLLFEYL